MTQTGKGKLHIGRFMNFRGPRAEEVELVIIDATSGAHFMTVSCSSQALINTLQKGGEEPCTWRLGALHIIGKQAETKTVEVPGLPEPVGERQRNEEWHAKVAAILAPYETDGWIGRVRDVENPHNIVSMTRCSGLDPRRQNDRDCTMRITFDRYVPVRPRKRKRKATAAAVALLALLIGGRVDARTPTVYSMPTCQRYVSAANFAIEQTNAAINRGATREQVIALAKDSKTAVLDATARCNPAWPISEDLAGSYLSVRLALELLGVKQ